jgi:protein SCO1/2
VKLIRATHLLLTSLALAAPHVQARVEGAPEASSQVSKEGSLMAPRELKDTEIIDKRGSKVPMDVMLTNHLGQPVRLGKYFNGDDHRPVILTLGYYKCPMLCSLVLNGLLEPLKTVSLKLGDDYRVVSVSINPQEDAELAAAKRKGYLTALGATQSGPWDFHVGEEAQVRRLADSVGFQYKYHERSKEYVHSAGIFILSPEGVLSRTLYGIAYKEADLKMALLDAGKGKIGSLLDKVILSCFHYDPDSHKYGLYVFGVMRLGGLLTVLILGIVLALYWRNEKRAKTIS